MKLPNVYYSFAAVGMLVSINGFSTVPAAPLSLANAKSGISLTLGGQNGTDWAVERTFHNDDIADEIIYMKADTPISMAHNERNVITKEAVPQIPRIVGINGADGTPDSGDEGDIHWKVDRDEQAHQYSTTAGPVIPAYAPKYTAPVVLSALTYNGSLPVVGTVGDNGAAYGLELTGTTNRFCYGQRDTFSNEWHTLTYWDDDIPIFTKTGADPHRQGASDGHLVSICVNPRTPVIQLRKPDGAEAEFYTTPIKAYHIPKVHTQRSYVTDEVLLSFVNLSNGEPVQYRVGNKPFTDWNGALLRIGDLIKETNTPVVIEARNGSGGPVMARTFILNPAFPAPQETHGNMLWANEAGRAEVQRKLSAVEPFKTVWKNFKISDFYQDMNVVFSNTRGIWRATAGSASTALNNAMVYAVEPGAANLNKAELAKTRLLRMFRLKSIGYELEINSATPANDYFNELSQTMQQFADAAVAYDLLAGYFRATDHPSGLTPIEELRIRDGIGEIAFSLLRYLTNWNAISGAGEVHWGHGYEVALGICALAMPTYKSDVFGVSGADRITTNDLMGADGKYWNPFPNQAVTWYAAAGDATLDTPGTPGLNAPLHAEFLLTDDGYWTGPNDLVGDGDRYYAGPMGSRLVDIKNGSMYNAECRVDLAELGGYEAPFVGRHYAWEAMRRMRGDTNIVLCSQNYNRRLLQTGVNRYTWNTTRKIYEPVAPDVSPLLEGFNSTAAYAGLPAIKSRVSATLQAAITNSTISKNLNNPYALSLCADPATIPDVQPGALSPAHPAMLRPIFKQVVAPSEEICKKIVAYDFDDQPVSITVSNLPSGASYDSNAQLITWTPSASDAGVHMIFVNADDGITGGTTRPFPVIVMPAANRGVLPNPPLNATATYVKEGNTVFLNWNPPASGTVSWYCIYKEGSLVAVTDGTTTEWTDRELIHTGSSARYNISAFNTNGNESYASDTTPAIFRY